MITVTGYVENHGATPADIVIETGDVVRVVATKEQAAEVARDAVYLCVMDCEP